MKVTIDFAYGGVVKRGSYEYFAGQEIDLPANAKIISADWESYGQTDGEVRLKVAYSKIGFQNTQATIENSYYESHERAAEKFRKRREAEAKVIAASAQARDFFRER